MATATRTRTSPISPDAPAGLEKQPRAPQPSRPASPPPAGRPSRRRLHGWLLAVAWVELATALQLVRIGGVPPWRSIWAEDGGAFLPQALGDPVDTLFRTHAGYFQFASRAMGSIASLVPLEWASVVFAVGGALVAAVLSVYVYRVSDSVLRTRWARGLMAAIMVLTPAAVFEVSDSGVDLHWYFLFASFWGLWSVSQAPKQLTADALVVAVAVWSSPLTVFFAPLALRRLILGSGWKRWIVPGAFAIGAAAQGIYRLTHPVDALFGERYLPNIPPFVGLRVVASALVGDGYLRDAWEGLGWTLVFVTAGVTVAVLAYGLAVGRGRRTFLIAATGYAVILTVASLVLRGTGDRVVEGTFSLGGSRYTFVPILLLTAAFIAVADSPGGRRWLRVLPAVLVAGATAANAFSPMTLRTAGPDWPKAVERARVSCSAPEHVVMIPTAPGGWKAPVECRRLLKR